MSFSNGISTFTYAERLRDHVRKFDQALSSFLDRGINPAGSSEGPRTRKELDGLMAGFLDTIRPEHTRGIQYCAFTVVGGWDESQRTIWRDQNPGIVIYSSDGTVNTGADGVRITTVDGYVSEIKYVKK